METLNRRDACNLIVDAMSSKVKLDITQLETIVFAVNNDLQVRDFLMGLPKYFPMKDAIKFMMFMCAFTKGEQQAPFITILAMYVYEEGETDDAKELLAESLKLNAEYSLTLLLQRVVNSGWPSKGLTAMRDDLADKVMVACYGTEGSEPIAKKVPDADNV